MRVPSAQTGRRNWKVHRLNATFESRDEYPHRILPLQSSASGARLELEGGLDTGREVASYTARRTGAGMSAAATVYVYGDDGLPTYFEDLAEQWRGWAGARSWSSLEGQLSRTPSTTDSEPSGWLRT